ncbi:hypothetical protein FRC03_002909 [Tulasnella sp. 419]|nr:hypothetical protein FRC03_002909 [Tulasnella sp. 419]
MLFHQVFHNIVIALCAILSSSPFPPITTSVSSLVCTTFLDAVSPPPPPPTPPTCLLVLFPDPALVGLMLEGRYVLTETEFIQPHHRFMLHPNMRQPVHGDGQYSPTLLNYFTRATHCLDLRVSRDGLCVLVCFAIILMAYLNKSSSGSSVSVAPSTLNTSASMAPYSGSISIISPPTQNGIFVSLPHRHNPPSIHLSNLEVLLIQYLIFQQSVPIHFLPMYLSEVAGLTSLSRPEMASSIFPPSPRSVLDNNSSSYHASSLIALSNLFHSVLFRIVVTMQAGWVPFITTGVIFLDSNIAGFLSRARDGHFQASICGVNFNCQFAFVLCNKQFILELSLTSDVVGSVIGWCPPQITWYTENALQCIMAPVPTQQINMARKEQKVPILTWSRLVNRSRNVRVFHAPLVRSPSSTFNLFWRLASFIPDNSIEPSLHGMTLIPYVCPVPSRDNTPSSIAVTEVENDSIPEPSNTNDNSDEVSESCPPLDERRIPRKERRARRIKEFRNTDWYKQQKKESKKERARVKAQQRAAQQAGQTAAAAPAPEDDPDSSLTPTSSDGADNSGEPSSARQAKGQN